MKASQFASILRKLIHEEVRLAVKEELKPIKAMLAEGRKPVKQSTPQRPSTPKRSNPLVSFDGPISQILNETAQSMINQQEEWPDMNNGTFTAEHAQNFGGSSLMSMLDSTPEDLPAMGYGADPTAAFIKDYSAVMKAADQHASGRF